MAMAYGLSLMTTDFSSYFYLEIPGWTLDIPPPVFCPLTPDPAPNPQLLTPNP